jgi:predicted small metal-binding protein
MKKRLSCRDMGAACDFTVCANTEEEVFQKAAEHGRTAHNLDEIPKEMLDKARSVMQDVRRC